MLITRTHHRALLALIAISQLGIIVAFWQGRTQEVDQNLFVGVSPFVWTLIFLSTIGIVILMFNKDKWSIWTILAQTLIFKIGPVVKYFPFWPSTTDELAMSGIVQDMLKTGGTSHLLSVNNLLNVHYLYFPSFEMLATVISLIFGRFDYKLLPALTAFSEVVSVLFVYCISRIVLDLDDFSSAMASYFYGLSDSHSHIAGFQLPFSAIFYVGSLYLLLRLKAHRKSYMLTFTVMMLGFVTSHLISPLLWILGVSSVILGANTIPKTPRFRKGFSDAIDKVSSLGYLPILFAATSFVSWLIVSNYYFSMITLRIYGYYFFSHPEPKINPTLSLTTIFLMNTQKPIWLFLTIGGLATAFIGKSIHERFWHKPEAIFLVGVLFVNGGIFVTLITQWKPGQLPFMRVLPYLYIIACILASICLKELSCLRSRRLSVISKTLVGSLLCIFLFSMLYSQFLVTHNFDLPNRNPVVPQAEFETVRWLLNRSEDIAIISDRALTDLAPALDMKRASGLLGDLWYPRYWDDFQSLVETHGKTNLQILGVRDACIVLSERMMEFYRYNARFNKEDLTATFLSLQENPAYNKIYDNLHVYCSTSNGG